MSEHRSSYTIRGVDPDTELETLTNGAKQSKSPYRFDLIDAATLFDLAEIRAAGSAKYGPTNHQQISIEDHINHAIAHFYAWLAGDRSDNHLGHALCRALFAREVELRRDQQRPAVEMDHAVLERENELLRAALREYGEHKIACAVMVDMEADARCTCGLRAAITGETFE